MGDRMDVLLLLFLELYSLGVTAIGVRHLDVDDLPVVERRTRVVLEDTPSLHVDALAISSVQVLDVGREHDRLVDQVVFTEEVAVAPLTRGVLDQDLVDTANPKIVHADVDAEQADDCQQKRQVGPEAAGLKSVDGERHDTESGDEEQRSDEDAVLLVAVLDGVIQHAGHVDMSLQPALAKDGTEHFSSKGIDRPTG